MVSTTQLSTMLSALGFQGLESTDIVNCLDKIGFRSCDDRDYISIQEFIKIASPFFGRRESREESDRLFELFDEESTGTVSWQNLMDLSREIGLNLDENTLREMIKAADKDNDGVLSKVEFKSVLERNAFAINNEHCDNSYLSDDDDM